MTFCRIETHSTIAVKTRLSHRHYEMPTASFKSLVLRRNAPIGFATWSTMIMMEFLGSNAT